MRRHKKTRICAGFSEKFKLMENEKPLFIPSWSFTVLLLSL